MGRLGNRGYAVGLAIVFVAAGVSGCLDSGSEEAVDIAADADAEAGAQVSSGDEGVNASANASANVSFEPPFAAFDAAPSGNATDNLTVGVEIVFNASASSDPHEGNLSYAWDFGDNLTAEGPLTNHSYNASGEFVVTLTVTSDVSDLSSNATQNLTILEAVLAGRVAVTFKDPSGDGTTNYHDLREITVSDDELMMTVKYSLGGIQPGHQTESAVCQSIFVLNQGKSQRYEPFGDAGTYMVYDYAAGGNMAGAKVTVAGSVFTVQLPLEKMNLEFPVQVYLESRTGECTFVGGNANGRLDRAPDVGTVAYG